MRQQPRIHIYNGTKAFGSRLPWITLVADISSVYTSKITEYGTKKLTI